MDTIEYILCSAIWCNDGKKHEHQPTNVPKGFVISGRRHHNCFITAFILLNDTKLTSVTKKVIQGFLTNTDRFVTRKSAGKIALQAGQTNKETDLLISEDLY